MRTTIDIPDQLFRHAKAAASLDGKSLKTFFTEALEAKVFGSEDGPKPGQRTQFPLVKSGKPGSVVLDGAGVSKALEDEDIPASR